MTTRRSVVVIGVGNDFRRDDGVGPAVLRDIDRLLLPDVRTVVSDGEPTQLLDAWTGADLAVVIDAVRCEPSRPGRIHRTTLAGPEVGTGSGTAGGTHGLGIPEAVLLGAELGRVPHRLVIYAVEAADLGFGVGLSEAVDRARPQLLRAIVAEVALSSAPTPAPGTAPR